MNRIFPLNPQGRIASVKSTNPVYRPTQRLRDDAENILRDVAYVLQLTRRVKSEILEERKLAETASV